MSGYIGFGKQSEPGPATSPSITIPIVGADDEICEVCDSVDKRGNMHLVGFDCDWGGAVYVCSDAHPKPRVP